MAKPELIPLDWVGALNTTFGTDNELALNDVAEAKGLLEEMDEAFVINGGGGGGGGGVHTDGVPRETFLCDESNTIPAGEVI